MSTKSSSRDTPTSRFFWCRRAGRRYTSQPKYTSGTCTSLQVAIVLIVLALVFLTFIRERFPPDVSAMIGVAALLVAGILTPAELLGSFSNHASITIGAMFIISAALEKTGVIDTMGRVVGRLSGASWLRTMLVTMVCVMGLSAFMNNTPVVVIMTPILLAVAPFGMFEITAAGLITAGVGILFLLTAGRWLLPDISDDSGELKQALRDRRFLAELQVSADSDYDGRRLGETRLGRSVPSQVLQIIRQGYPLRDELATQVLRPYDRILVETTTDELMSMANSRDLWTREQMESPETGRKALNPKEREIGEAVIGPDSPLVNQLIGSLDVRERHGIEIVGLHRPRGLRGNEFEKLRLQAGDSVLVAGTAAGLQRAWHSREFTGLSLPELRPYRREKAWIAVLAMAGVMLLAGLDVMPIVALALIAAVVVVAAGCVTSDEAYQSVQWSLLILIFAMRAIGTAMQTSGAALLIAEQMAYWVAPLGAFAMLSLIYLIISVMTETMSNNAAVIPLTPIAVGLALTLGYDPRPFVVAVMFAGSACQ